MLEILFLLILTGFYPLARAWLANRGTSLSHAATWACLAWLGWLAAWWGLDAGDVVLRYAALCLACCPGIAVLGARRPTVAAWDMVVVGMLTVMFWPLLEGAIIGRTTLGMLNLVFPAGVLAVGVVNYLPTRMGLPVLLAGIGWFAEWLTLATNLDGATEVMVRWLAGACFAAAPWLAYLTWPSRASADAFDRLWLDFRDRYGLAWGQRVREQFNRAVANAGWPVILSWRGLQVLEGTQLDDASQREIMDVLTALLQRFTATLQRPS